MEAIEKVKKMSRTKIHFNKTEYQKELENCQLQCDAINKAITLSKGITNDEIPSYKMEDVNAYLRKKTGFPSADASAKLLEVNIQYLAFESHLTSFKDLTDVDISKRFKKAKNGYMLNEAFITELETKHTTFLPSNLEAVNSKLEQIASLLNEADLMQSNSTTSIKRDYAGKWVVNVKHLNLLNQLR